MGFVERITLYVDVFLLVNGGMDLLLLGMTGWLLGLSARRGRLLLAAVLGTAWSFLGLFLPRLPVWGEMLITWILVGGGMVLLAFGRERAVSRWGVFCLVSVTAGGVFTVLGEEVPAAWYLTGARTVRQWRLVPFSLTVLLLALAGRVFLSAAARLFRGRTKLYQVTLFHRGKTLSVTALWDTGNRLYEPYGHRPVHVVTEGACRQLCDAMSRLIYIPFRTVGDGQGVLPGIRIDRMEVLDHGKVIRTYEKPWLAISRRHLSETDRYQMLLHGEDL